MPKTSPPAAATTPRIFLLSPANCNGKRAQLVRTSEKFDLALRLRRGGATLGEVFAFVSGLYFRGKLAYAQAFTTSDRVFVITPSDGLQAPDLRVRLSDIERFAAVPIGVDEARYRAPLERDLRQLARKRAYKGAEVVLLGSIATPKYLEILTAHFGSSLRYPREFVGRGDMSRGALLLRQVRAGVELEYTAALGSNGKR